MDAEWLGIFERKYWFYEKGWIIGIGSFVKLGFNDSLHFYGTLNVSSKEGWKSPLMNLNQVTVPCTELSRSIAFYELLGLRLIVHTHDAYARFECPDGEATFSLHRYPEAINEVATIVYFESSKLDEEVERLQKAGVEFDLMPKDQPWLWREAHLRDPDENRIILYFAGEARKNPPWRLK